MKLNNVKLVTLFVICTTILCLGITALAAFLSVWTECYHYLWLLTVPILCIISWMGAAETYAYQEANETEWEQYKKKNGIKIKFIDKEDKIDGTDE